MFSFVMPRADGTVYCLLIGARDLDHAFKQFACYWWTATDHTRSIGVWQEAALVARVLPVGNARGDAEPFMQELSP